VAEETTFRPCFVCGREVECEPGYPEDIKVACWWCIDSAARGGEALAAAIRDLIAALEEKPSLGLAEDRLLVNLRNTLEEWESDSEG
jgi:hypothetical protein